MRYLRLYLHFLRFSFSRSLEFRVDFYLRIVMDCVYYAVGLAFFAMLYTKTGLVGGWTLDQTYVFVCGYMLVDAVHMTVFANNLWMLPIFVNKGDLDYYLVRPVSSLYFLSLRDFAANSFVNLIVASGLVAWALARYPEPLGAARIGVFLVLLLNGAFVTYVVRLLFIVPVFWLHSNRGLDEINFSIEKLGERPHQIYTGWVRRALLTIVPYALISSIPSHVLFDGLTVGRAVHVSMVTAGLFGVAFTVWRLGLRAYASASS